MNRLFMLGLCFGVFGVGQGAFTQKATEKAQKRLSFREQPKCAEGRGVADEAVDSAAVGGREHAAPDPDIGDAGEAIAPRSAIRLLTRVWRRR